MKLRGEQKEEKYVVGRIKFNLFYKTNIFYFFYVECMSLHNDGIGRLCGTQGC